MIRLFSQICMDTTKSKGEYYIKCDESLALTNKLNTYWRGEDNSAKINQTINLSFSSSFVKNKGFVMVALDVQGG